MFTCAPNLRDAAAHWRTCMLMALVLARNGTYIVEQPPRQSLLYRHPRFRWLSSTTRVGGSADLFRLNSASTCVAQSSIYLKSTTSEVYRSCWWMGLYSDPATDENWSPKRQISWSNSRHIWSLDIGQLRRPRALNRKTKTVHRYKDARGKSCYSGTKYLKPIESLSCNMVWVSSNHQRQPGPPPPPPGCWGRGGG